MNLIRPILSFVFGLCSMNMMISKCHGEIVIVHRPHHCPSRTKNRNLDVPTYYLYSHSIA